jgi:TolA-binding protein
MQAFQDFYNTPPEVIIGKLVKFVESHPQSTWADEALLKAGELAEKLKKHDQALSYYQRVISEYSLANKLEENFLWRNYISESEIASINELYTYYDKHPNSSMDLAWLRIANCYRSQGKLEQSQEILLNLISKYPQGLWEAEDLARIHILQEEKVFPLYGAAWWRPHREAYLQLAHLYAKQNQIDKAIEITAKFLEKFGQLNLFWEVKYNLASLYQEEKKVAKAQEILEKIIPEVQASKSLDQKSKDRLLKITQEKIKQIEVQ